MFFFCFFFYAILFTFSSTFTPLDWVRPPQEKFSWNKIKEKKTFLSIASGHRHHPLLYYYYTRVPYNTFSSLSVLLTCHVSFAMLGKPVQCSPVSFSCLLSPALYYSILVFLLPPDRVHLNFCPLPRWTQVIYTYIMYYVNRYTPHMLHFHVFRVASQIDELSLIPCCLLFIFQVFVMTFFLLSGRKVNLLVWFFFSPKNVKRFSAPFIVTSSSQEWSYMRVGCVEKRKDERDRGRPTEIYMRTQIKRNTGCNHAITSLMTVSIHIA